MQMELILLKNIKNLGRVGDVAQVAMGYGRYLLRQQAALRATADNKETFHAQRGHWEKLNLAQKADAQKLADALDDKIFVLVRQAGEAGHLYGSVSSRDVAELLAGEGFKIHRTMVLMPHPFKTIGVHDVSLDLHTDVKTQVRLIIAKSLDEAEVQKKKLSPPKVDESQATVEA